MAIVEFRDVLEQLLNQVDVGHDHTAAAVPLAAELIHSITVAQCQSSRGYDSQTRCWLLLPIRDVVVNQGEVALPEIACHLCRNQPFGPRVAS